MRNVPRRVSSERFIGRVDQLAAFDEVLVSARTGRGDVVLMRDKVDHLARLAHISLDSPEVVAGPVEHEAEGDRYGLTHRELEVLRLVAQGFTNGEIGQSLFISRKTASVHVSNILRKLGVSNRVEAATFLTKQDVDGLPFN